MGLRGVFTRVPGSPRLWLMLFLACALVFGFFEVVDDVFYDVHEGDLETHAFDRDVTQYFAQFRSESLTQIAVDLTALGSISVLSVFALFAYAAILVVRDWIGLLHMSAALLGAAAWPQLLKPYFGRERPGLIDHLVTVGDLSFPSGHSFGSAAAYATFAFFCARYIRLRTAEALCYFFAVAIVTVVGMTRIYLGVHYPTDVIAGLCAGGAWAFLLAAGFSILYQKRPLWPV
jgi:undecaprenyl-diphosphatase